MRSTTDIKPFSKNVIEKIMEVKRKTARLKFNNDPCLIIKKMDGKRKRKAYSQIVSWKVACWS